MELKTRPFISAERIQRRVAELAGRISADFSGQELLVIAVLKGGVIFAADLVRSITIPISVDFIRARSYERTRSSESVTFSYLPEEEIAGRHVLVVEDIIDTGRTSRAIVEYLNAKLPASVTLCALLDKPSRREVTMEAQYVGFAIEDHFVVGYGLDYEQWGRQLPDIHILESD